MAVTEALILGMVLILPMMWLLSVLSAVHSAALATSSAVREAGVVISRSLDGRQGLNVVIAESLRNHGLDPSGGTVEVAAPRGFVRGAIVEIGVTYQVPVFDPPFLPMDIGPTLTVRSRHSARIDPYRSR